LLRRRALVHSHVVSIMAGTDPKHSTIPVAYVRKIDAIIRSWARTDKLYQQSANLLIRADASDLKGIAERLEFKARESADELAADAYRDFAKLARKLSRQAIAATRSRR
jgi:hypothetical protein